jgi:hypothetical protein
MNKKNYLKGKNCGQSPACSVSQEAYPLVVKKINSQSAQKDFRQDQSILFIFTKYV